MQDSDTIKLQKHLYWNRSVFLSDLSCSQHGKNWFIIHPSSKMNSSLTCQSLFFSIFPYISNHNILQSTITPLHHINIIKFAHKWNKAKKFWEELMKPIFISTEWLVDVVTHTTYKLIFMHISTTGSYQT